MSSQRDSIKLVIMSTGEHIIGFVTNSDVTKITIDKPVSLVPDPSSNGQRITFMPYLQFSEEECADFPQRDIRHILTPNKHLVDNFYQQFGVGIVTPPAGGGRIVR